MGSSLFGFVDLNGIFFWSFFFRVRFVGTKMEAALLSVEQRCIILLRYLRTGEICYPSLISPFRLDYHEMGFTLMVR